MDAAWGKHVEPAWGTREVSQITPSDVQQWVSEFAATRSATTVKRALGVLAGILDTVVNERRLNRNPAKGVGTPRKRPKAPVYLSHEQVHSLASESTHPPRPDPVPRSYRPPVGATQPACGGATSTCSPGGSASQKTRYSSANRSTSAPEDPRSRVVPFPKFLRPSIRRLVKAKRPDQLLFGDGDHHMRAPKTQTGWLQSAVSRVQAAELKIAVEARERGEKHPA